MSTDTFQKTFAGAGGCLMHLMYSIMMRLPLHLHGIMIE